MEHEEQADRMDEDAERMEQHSDRLGQRIEEVEEDWERKEQDPSVPGAQPEPGRRKRCRASTPTRRS
jgi:hypothetical protein